MDVKISYAIPFERVPSKVDDLLREAARNLEIIASQTKPAEGNESTEGTLEKLKNIDSARRKLVSVDLLLADCYTILASYNKELAEMHMPKQQEATKHGTVFQGGSSSNPTESTNS